MTTTNSYATDGRCHNAEPGTYGHECGKPATWIGRNTNGFASGFCDRCRAGGYEARGVVDWTPFPATTPMHAISIDAPYISTLEARLVAAAEPHVAVSYAVAGFVLAGFASSSAAMGAAFRWADLTACRVTVWAGNNVVADVDPAGRCECAARRGVAL